MGDFVKPSDEKISEENKNLTPLPKHKKFLTLVDEETGKTIGLFPIKPKNLGKGWVALYQDVIIQVAKEKLTGEQCRVFLYLLGKVNFENYLTINQNEISQELNIHRVNVTKAIKHLKELEIIIEGSRNGLNKTYRLNPYIAHKGAEREKTIIDFKQLLKEKEDAENPKNPDE